MKVLSVLYLTTAVSLGACGDFSTFDGDKSSTQSSSTSSLTTSYPFQSTPLNEFIVNPEASTQSWESIRDVALRKVDKIAFDALYDAALAASKQWDKVTPIAPNPADQAEIDRLKALSAANYTELMHAQKDLDKRIQARYTELDLANPPLLCSRYVHGSLISSLSRDSVLEHEFLVRRPAPTKEEISVEYAKKDDYIMRIRQFKTFAADIEAENERLRQESAQRHREIYESKMAHVPEGFYTRQQDMLKTLVWDYIQKL
jgi:hypothetical protein